MSSSAQENVWIIQYNCQRCGKACEVRLDRPGFPPRYCAGCAKAAPSDRVKRWRERHPEAARVAAKKQNDKRPKMAGPLSNFAVPTGSSDVNATAFAVQSLKTYTVNGFTASAYQSAILAWVEARSGDLLVKAAAGSAKSTTLIEALRLAPALDQEKIALTFNKHIERDLKHKLKGTRIAAQTIHSVGYQALSQHFGGSLPRANNSKYRGLAELWLKDALQARFPAQEPKGVEGFYEWRDSLTALCNFVRLTLTHYSSRSELMALCNRFGLMDADDYWLFEGVPWIIEQGESQAREQKIYDITDMLWLPYTWHLNLGQMQFIAVDETQDLNALQREIVLRLRAPGGRILWVGDPDQAIMGFTGADVQSFLEIQQVTKAQQLPLSISYRYPRSHVELARKIVTTIEARPNAPVGKIEDISDQKFLTIAQPGDMILCRRTAPLVKMALKFIAAGRQARVRGQDEFGKGLSTLVDYIVKRTNATFANFERSVNRYRELERERLSYRESTEAQLATIDDKCQSLIAIYRNSAAVNLDDFKTEIEALFKDASNTIMLSTVHRAKGLEAARVFILEPETMPLKWKGQQDWEYEQEMHIKYVALTRSKDELYFVQSSKDKPK